MTTPDPAPIPETAASPAVEAVLTDYADLGTAFGLDASVARGTTAPIPLHPAPEAAPPTPPWEHRLIRRHGL